MKKASAPIDPITAEELVSELRRLRDRIPMYQVLTRHEARAMLRVAHLDPEFVDVGLNSISAHDVAASHVGYSEDELRAMQEEHKHWTAAETELQAMAAGVAGANLKRRHIIGRSVLLVYNLFRMLIRKDGNADLIPWVTRMRETNRFGHKRKMPE
jgi:hypothetical protein